MSMRRRIAAAQQGAYLNAQRGNVWTSNGFESGTAPNRLSAKPDPMVLDHYRDRYARVYPDGPYDRSWQGVQRINPIAALSIGKQVLNNPLQTARMRLTSIQRDNMTAHSIGAGTALAAVNEQQAALAATARPSLASQIGAKLRSIYG